MNTQHKIHTVAGFAGIVAAAVGCRHPGLESLVLGGLLFALIGSLACRPASRLWPLLLWAGLLYATTVGFPKRAVSVGLRDVITGSLVFRDAMNFLVALWLFEGAGWLTAAQARRLCGLPPPCSAPREIRSIKRSRPCSFGRVMI